MADPVSDRKEWLTPFPIATGGSVLHEEDTEESLSPFTTTTGGQIQYETETPLTEAFSVTAGISDALTHGEVDVSNAARQYQFMLTGTADGLSNIVIPISSFQSRIKSGDPTYLSVVIPSYAYVDAITARSNGELVLRMRYVMDGEALLYTEIARATLDDIKINQGASSRSITLDGYKTSTFLPKSITLENPSYKALSDGKLRYRCKPDLYVRPGDTVTVDTDTFVVDNISWSVSVGSETFEVQE